MKKLKVIDKISEQTIDLKERWANFRREIPQVRIRDAAKELGVSEAELLATQIGDSVVRLNDNFDDILQELHALGRIIALTRNEEIVHERKGEYKNVEVLNGHGKMGLVLGDDIDLRIFFKNWHFGFAVTNENPSGTTRSFQFFDRSGTAVHKVFLTDASNLTAYENLAEKYRGGDQNRILKVASKSAKKAEKPDSEIDVEGFRRAWAALKDTHDFFPLLQKFGVARRQALRLADRKMAYPVAADAYKYVLEKAAAMRLPIMIFVGNDGIIQIHTGEVERLSEARGWFNVLDERFNLHIKQDEITSAWIVKKPTTDGIVSSIELFNKLGENVALFFGKRKPGTSEREEWRELLACI